MKAQVPLVFVAIIVAGLSGCGAKTPKGTTHVPEVSPVQMIAVAETEEDSTSFYSVDKYDPGANPAEDLAATVSRASKSGKTIILEVGGQW